MDNEKVDNEFGLREVLAKHNIDSPELLSDIEDQLNLKINQYLQSRDSIRRSAFVELKCCLITSLIRSKSKGREQAQVVIHKMFDDMEDKLDEAEFHYELIGNFLDRVERNLEEGTSPLSDSVSMNSLRIENQHMLLEKQEATPKGELLDG